MSKDGYNSGIPCSYCLHDLLCSSFLLFFFLSPFLQFIHAYIYPQTLSLSLSNTHALSLTYTHAIASVIEGKVLSPLKLPTHRSSPKVHQPFELLVFYSWGLENNLC